MRPFYHFLFIIVCHFDICRRDRKFDRFFIPDC